MNISINSVKISTKILLSFLLCLAMVSTSFAGSADAAAKKDGKTGIYNGMTYIAHKDIPAYMGSYKKEITNTINKGSKSGVVKILNLPSAFLNEVGLTNWPTSLQLAKSYLWIAYYGVYAEIKWKDKGKGIYFDKKGNIKSQ